MATNLPTRSWYARRLPRLRYQVTCTHSNGVTEDCGITLPAESHEDGRQQLLSWLAEYALPMESVIINDHPGQEALS